MESIPLQHVDDYAHRLQSAHDAAAKAVSVPHPFGVPDGLNLRRRAQPEYSGGDSLRVYTEPGGGRDAAAVDRHPFCSGGPQLADDAVEVGRLRRRGQHPVGPAPLGDADQDPRTLDPRQAEHELVEFHLPGQDFRRDAARRGGWFMLREFAAEGLNLGVGPVGFPTA